VSTRPSPGTGDPFVRLIILGSGTSFGVPQIGCDCAVCRSSDPRDRRTRVAALVEGDDGRRILIDTPPELRLQLTGAGIDAVDAVLYTHDHADHVMGIDDLRALSVRYGRLPVYGPPDTLERLGRRFDYIFDASAPALPGTPKPELTTVPLAPWREVEIAGLRVTAIPFQHGSLTVFGYRIGPVGYVTDVKQVPPAAVERLRGVSVLVLNALLDRPHPTHLSIPEAIEVARTVGAGRTLFTHLTHRTSHADLAGRLPPGIEPAQDGLSIVL
jgi:phosphoribosyl 1,2-cyclic phosphate phosphodiesterase